MSFLQTRSIFRVKNSYKKHTKQVWGVANVFLNCCPQKTAQITASLLPTHSGRNGQIVGYVAPSISSIYLPKALCSLGPLPRLPLHRFAQHGSNCTRIRLHDKLRQGGSQGQHGLLRKQLCEASQAAENTPRRKESDELGHVARIIDPCLFDASLPLVTS